MAAGRAAFAGSVVVSTGRASGLEALEAAARAAGAKRCRGLTTTVADACALESTVPSRTKRSVGGRRTAVASRARSILRGFDRCGGVSPHGHSLANLLNVDWTGLLARQVLTESPLAHRDIRCFFGHGTISAVELVRAYEPSLLETALALLRDNPSLASKPASPLHDPVFCCALFGWSRIASALLSAGACADRPGENGVLPSECARAHGWRDVLAVLEGATSTHDNCVVARFADGTPGLRSSCDDRPSFGRLLCSAASRDVLAPCSEWRTSSQPSCSSRLLPEGAAQVPEVDGTTLTVAEFDRDFFRAKCPVIIRGGVGASSALRWALDDVVAAIDEDAAVAHSVCSIPYPQDWLPPVQARAACRPGGAAAALRHRGCERGCSSGDVGIRSPGYLFVEVEEGSVLAKVLDRDLDLRKLLPDILGPTGGDVVMLRQFALGQSGTGAPWHWHQDAFNACAIGERFWYFRAPADALASSQPVGEGVPEATTSWRGVQRPGDVVYVPELWSHTVINRVLSVAVSIEFGSVA
eukprot:TRINITY_DN9547_c2_g2_i1.p1 TRINITY_DN9547_c2_g2~~TRINITY_DN9547_c2_g2_i1.p1  ORF type:complete len:550 (+),score=70.48 TRINITY_DN9547_c2_g2_i1:70-1650(+)